MTNQAENYQDTPPGTLLGQLDYTLVQTDVEITNWTHYNWYDDEPLQQAFRAMMKSLPECVTNVTVEDDPTDPTAFWASLGFIHTSKGGNTLTYSPADAYEIF